MHGTDSCVAPVLTPREAMADSHLRARGTFVTVDGVTQPAPAPRFSRTAPEIQSPPSQVGDGMDAALAAWGFSASEIATPRDDGGERQPSSTDQATENGRQLGRESGCE